MKQKQPVKLDPDSLSFAERVRQRLQKLYQGEILTSSCLLLDASGSMLESIGDKIDSKRKIDALRELAEKFPYVRRFVFNSTCWEIPPGGQIPAPDGGTSMHAAFLELKSSGLTHAVMITDGIPDDVRLAIETSQGLRLDIFYVGPDPAPDLLKYLAERSGGEYGRATFADNSKALEAKIRGLLSQPKS